MPKTTQALRRYRLILKILSRQGQHASKDIYKACVNSGYDITYRTTQNDLKALRDDNSIFGRDLNIVEDKKTKKWYSTNIPKELFATLELEDGEVDALLFYTKILKQYKDYPIFGEISRAMKKVFKSSNISSEIQDLFESETWIETEEHELIKGIELIPEILDAIHKKKIIKIEYQKFEDCKSKIHIIEPILLKEDRKMWYIIGFHCKHRNLTTYALDRIIQLKLTDDSFKPQQFSSNEYFKHSFGITVSNQTPIKVLISFSPNQAHYIRTLKIHPTQIIENNDIENFTISVNVKPSYEFFSKILSFGKDATIISPPNIRDEFEEIFKQALNNYK